MSKKILRAESWVERFEGIVIFVALCGLVGALFIQVLFRFVLSNPLDFTEELARICMIWIVFVGAARALYLCEHFIVDFVVEMLPTAPKVIVGYLVDAICIGVVAVLAFVGINVVVAGAGQTMPALGLSVSVQTAAMPLGFTLMLFHCVCAILRRRHVNVHVFDTHHTTDHEPAIAREV